MKSRSSIKSTSVIKSFWKVAQSTVVILPYSVQISKRLGNWTLWANVIYGDVSLTCVWDGYPILHKILLSIGGTTTPIETAADPLQVMSWHWTMLRHRQVQFWLQIYVLRIFFRIKDLEFTNSLIRHLSKWPTRSRKISVHRECG